MKPKILQWHPGFYAALQIEFEEESDKLQFENEHLLGKKPMSIDVLVIKVRQGETIHKNIGRIFRQHNLIEYKNPDDHISLNDFFKVSGYACFYQSDTNHVKEVLPDEITITLVCNHYPRKMIRYLMEYNDVTIEKNSPGIYCMAGWFCPVQIIIGHELPSEENMWISRLRKDLDVEKDMEPLARVYKEKRNHPLYSAAMDLIFRANPEQSEEGKYMCEAIRELFAEELREGEIRGEQRGELRGEQRGEQKGIYLTKMTLALTKEGYKADEIARRLDTTVEVVVSILE